MEKSVMVELMKRKGKKTKNDEEEMRVKHNIQQRNKI